MDTLTGKSRRPASTLAKSALFLVFILVLFHSASCVKKREPGPLLIWLDLTGEEAAVFNELLGEFKKITGIEAAIELKQMDLILRDFDSPDLKKLETPDLIEVDTYHLEQARPRVMELSHWTQETLDVRWLYISGVNPGLSGDQIHFIPYRLRWPVMIYNCNEIESPPSTWNELVKFAESEPGKIGLQGLPDENLALELLSWIWQGGGDPYMPAHPHTREVFYFLEKLAPLINFSSRAFRAQSLVEAQEAGEIYIHFNGPGQVKKMVDNGTMPSVHCTAPMPAGPDSPRVAVSARYLAVPLTSRHSKEAVKCMHFLTLIRAQSTFTKKFCWPPVRGDAWSFDTEAQAGAMAGFMRSAMSGVGLEARENFDEVSKLWVEAYQEIVFDRAPVEETLWKYQSRMEKLLE